MKTLRLLFLVGLATGFISEKTTPTTPDDLYLEGRTSGELPIDDEDGDDEDGSGSGSGDYTFGDLSDQEEMLKRFLNYSRTTVSKEMVPAEPQSTADSPRNTPITRADSQDRPITVEETETTPVIPDGDSRDMEVPGVVPTAEFPERTSPSSITVTTSETTAADIGSDLGEDNSLDRWDVSTTKASGDEGQSKEMDNEIVAKDGRGSRIYEKSVPEEVTSENMWERTEVLAAVIACGVVGFLCAVFLLLLIAYRMKKKDEGSYDLGDTKLSSTSYQKAPTKEFYA